MQLRNEKNFKRKQKQNKNEICGSTDTANGNAPIKGKFVTKNTVKIYLI